jgi:hypothetical protein
MTIGQKVEEEEGWLLNQWQQEQLERAVVVTLEMALSLLEITTLVEEQATIILTTITVLGITTIRILSSMLETGFSMLCSSKRP